MEIERHIVSIKLLGKEQKAQNSKDRDYAIQVMLSDESVYTVYRSKKKIARFNYKLINKFPVEAGYFNDKEKIIPDCPFKKTPFGIKQSTSDEAETGRLLNSYLKNLSTLPSKIIKCDVILQFMSLWSTDMELHEAEQKKEKKSRLPERKQSLRNANDSTISKPMQLRSYTTVADFKGQRFAFKKDMIVQVVQKDPKGWWLIDVYGALGWAPASYLVLKDEDEATMEEEENEALIVQDRVGARYLSTATYTAKRDDELSFMMGSIVRVVKKYIDGWWLVKYNGHEGFVPGSMFKKFDRRQATIYVKNIKRKFSTRRRSTIVVPSNKINWQKDDSINVLTEVVDQKSTIIYECMSKFIGKSKKFEISLNRGDMVHVLEEKDNGWWYVRDWHGRAGWAPASYLRDVHSPAESNNITDKIGSYCIVVSAFDSQNDGELSIEENDTVVVISVSENGWWTVRKSDDPSSKEGIVPSVCLKDLQDQNTNSQSAASPTVNDDNEFYDDSSDWLDQPETTDDVQDCYIVQTDYFKQSPDEIDALEGEIVCVIDKSHREMWYVESDGKEGWLYSNILRPITDKDISNSSSPGDSPARNTPIDNEITTSTTQKTDEPIIRNRSVSPSNTEPIIRNQSVSPSNTEPSIHLCVVSVSTDSSSSEEEEEDLEEIERAIKEAERIASEANYKAATLRIKAAEKKRTLNEMKEDKDDVLVERLV